VASPIYGRTGAPADAVAITNEPPPSLIVSQPPLATPQQTQAEADAEEQARIAKEEEARAAADAKATADLARIREATERDKAEIEAARRELVAQQAIMAINRARAAREAAEQEQAERAARARERNRVFFGSAFGVNQREPK
jgi:hypothetical protein